ncbi:MAG: hypothetical protein JRI68_25310, partial [Deltaproteobacteria bacterium]|nr:hypothetical protein [Deltaproteobacteria bacterium]
GNDDDGDTQAAVDTGQSTGIPECDEYLAKFKECNPGQTDAAAMMASGYKQAAGVAAAKNTVASRCAQALQSIKNCTPVAGGDSPSIVKGTAPPPVAVTPGKEATPFINSRSSVPSTAEWNAQTKEVTVRGSTALNCETKMVREWLRISCRGKNQSGGEPTGVVVTKGGGRGDDFVFTGNKVASLVVRFVPGVDLEARFNWTDKGSTCRVWWPRGAPEPEYKGTFR